MAENYIETNRLEEAVAILEKMLTRYDFERINETIMAVKAYYYLAQAYDKSGWKQKAIDKYTEFLEIWKNADAGIPEIEDAKVRLSKLKGVVSQ